MSPRRAGIHRCVERVGDQQHRGAETCGLAGERGPERSAPKHEERCEDAGNGESDRSAVDGKRQARHQAEYRGIESDRSAHGSLEGKTEPNRPGDEQVLREGERAEQPVRRVGSDDEADRRQRRFGEILVQPPRQLHGEEGSHDAE